MTYSEFGGIQQEQFGTLTPLYDKRHYNPRGQMYDQRLSSYSWSASEWDWNRGATINYFSSNMSYSGSGSDNNGNLIAQYNYAPENESYSHYDVDAEYYNYDSLNRLYYDVGYSYSTHSGAWQTDYVQQLNFDRWGNRTINPATWGNIPKPSYTVDSATNRLIAPSGYTYDYDAAGNQTLDTTPYDTEGGGTRTYDAENHMKTEWANSQTQSYTYDFNGRRIKRSVNGNEIWQVYGMSGELLAEYKSGAAPFLPSREYGYRGGEILVTMASGDDNRLSRFVTNLYRGALQRDPSSSELQSGINSLGSAGATGGYSSLLSAASSLAYSLFAATNYELNSGRSDTQFVADLYYTYLQRGPDDGGLGWWAGQVPGNGRYNVLLAFQYSGEFQTLVSTLYGTATSDNQRTEHIVNNFYLGALGRDANSSELATERDALNNAAAQGLTQVQSELENFARSIFASQIYDYSMSDQQFVTNLYEGFLQRGPDAGGLGFWTSIAANGNRQNVLNAFVGATEFRELAATLYREEFWLVRDRVGSPRMIVDKSGSLASVKRHDYLPFGEELTVGQARTPAVGFTGDDTRQKFTGYEHDSETGLNFAEARYQSSSQGRFTSIDPLMASAQVTSPQSFNRYSHALNNPLRFVDSSGMAAEEHDNEISAAFAELNSLADWADDVRQAQADKAKEDARKQQQQQQAPAQQTNQQNNQQGNAPRTPTKYDVTKDKAIGKQLDQIRAKAKPLASGQTPVLSDVKVVEGDTVDLNGQTLVDPYGQETQDPVFGTIKPIAYVPLDQGGNIIPDGSGIGIQEVISRNGSAPERIPADRLAPAPPGGVFFDMQFIATGQPTATVKQTVFVVQLSRSGGIASAFSIGQNSITLNAPMPGKTGSVSATIASPKRMQQ